MAHQIHKWECDFKCGRLGKRKEEIERHEQTCFSNPRKQSCKTCSKNARHGDTFRCMDGLLEPGVRCKADCTSWESMWDMKSMRFNPSSGERLKGTSKVSPVTFRLCFPAMVWVLNPWTGKPRGTENIEQDRFGKWERP